jgi:hypothetical protein
VTYDSRCYDLAAVFLEDARCVTSKEKHTEALAIEIQAVIEDYLSALEEIQARKAMP